MILSRIAVLTIGLAASFLPTVVNGSPYVIADDRVRSLDVTPALGRGYSIMTNSFQSTCLNIGGTTVPSYNYDYSFKEHIGTTSSTKDVEKSVSGTFAYWWVRGSYKSSSTSNESTKGNTHMIVATMRMERYYTSVREDLSTLSDPALQLLDRQDYVGFFKACGPNYVRSIRRAQEVTAMLNYSESDTEKAKDFSRNVSGSITRGSRSGPFSYDVSGDSKFKSSNKSLKITIKGYGLGLSSNGSEAMIATTIEEFKQVMKFAFRVMTQGKDSHQNGQVYGMEVVPWVDSTMYQIAANIDDEIIEIPLSRSLVPKAVKRIDLTDSSDFDNANRDAYTCIDAGFQVDKFGYCCELSSLYDVSIGDYDPALPEERICRPVRALDRTIIKNNLAANGEFVARLDRAVRFKLDHLATLERCISAVRSFPDRFDPYILKPQDTVIFDGQYDPDFTVFDLKTAIDPFNNFGMVKHLAKELDEFVEMFFAPCMAALFGTNIGNTFDTDPSYFMAYPWHTHEECLHLSCFGNGMRWNRDSPTGGCTPGLISGSSATSYSNAATGKCAYDNNKGDATEECKYSSSDMNSFHTQATACWGQSLPAGGIDYFMGQYCMPQLTGKKVDATIEQAQKDTALSNCFASSSTTSVSNTLYSEPFHIQNAFGKDVGSFQTKCANAHKVNVFRPLYFSHPGQRFEYHYATQAFILRLFPTSECTDGTYKAITAPADCADGDLKFESWTYNQDGSIADAAVLTGRTQAARQRWTIDKDTGVITSVGCRTTSASNVVTDKVMHLPTNGNDKEVKLAPMPSSVTDNYVFSYIFR